MRSKRFFSDASYLVWFTLALLLTLMFVSALSTVLHQREMTELVAEQNVLITQGYADTSQVILGHYQDQLNLISLSEDSTTIEKIASVIHDFDGGIYILNHRCEITETVYPGLVTTYLYIEDELDVCQQPAGTYSLVNNSFLLYHSTKQEGNRMVGIVSLEQFVSDVTGQHTTSEGSLWLISDEGETLFEVSGNGMPHQVRMMNYSLNDNAYAIVRMPMGELIISSAQIGDLPIKWVFAENWNQATSVLLRITQSVPLTLIPAVLIALLLLWFGINKIVKPLQLLEEVANKIGDGKYGNVDESVGGIKAIRNLQHEMISLTRKVQQTQMNLHSYIGAITNAQEEERKRVARELHDETLQSMIALNQRLQLLSLEDHQPKMSKAIQELLTLNNQNMRELRRITGNLRPGYLDDLGLQTSLEMLVHQFRVRHKSLVINTEFSVSEETLPFNVSLSFYRIAQEVLNNVVRHAEANEVDLSLMIENGSIFLTIFDDGKGFHIPDQFSSYAADGHFGLLGIRERAELINANLDIHSETGKGTQVRVRWKPVTE